MAASFENAIMKDIKNDVNKRMRDDSCKLRTVYDKVFEKRNGKSMGEIKQLLRLESQKIHLEIPDSELTDMANQIGSGGKLEIQARPLR